MCVGSDRVLGDAVGPLVGEYLIAQYQIPTYVYGRLSRCITASNLQAYAQFIEKHHPYNPVIVVDSALGAREDVGKIKVKKQGLTPGSAFHRQFEAMGDYSVVAIVGENTPAGKQAFPYVPLQRVRSLAKRIAADLSEHVQRAFGTNA